MSGQETCSRCGLWSDPAYGPHQCLVPPTGVFTYQQPSLNVCVHGLVSLMGCQWCERAKEHERLAALTAENAELRARAEAKDANAFLRAENERLHAKVTEMHRRAQRLEGIEEKLATRKMQIEEVRATAERERDRRVRRAFFIARFRQRLYREAAAMIVAAGVSDHVDGHDGEPRWHQGRLDVLIPRLVAQRDEARARVADQSKLLDDYIAGVGVDAKNYARAVRERNAALDTAQRCFEVGWEAIVRMQRAQRRQALHKAAWRHASQERHETHAALVFARADHAALVTANDRIVAAARQVIAWIEEENSGAVITWDARSWAGKSLADLKAALPQPTRGEPSTADIDAREVSLLQQFKADQDAEYADAQESRLIAIAREEAEERRPTAQTAPTRERPYWCGSCETFLKEPCMEHERAKR